MHSWIGLELFAIGILTGLRTLTPMAVLCWITVLGRFRAGAGWMSFPASRISVGIFSVLALGELIGDKLPNTPSRTKAPGLIARIVFGALTAGIVASAAGIAVDIGALIGVIGAIAGTFTGWFVRTRAVRLLKCPDLPIALIEDAIAVGGSILIYVAMAR